MSASGRTEKSSLTFFIVVFGLTIPFWLFGGNKLPTAVNLPVSALSAFVPGIAASILIFRREGRAGFGALLKRAADFKRIPNKIWYLPVLLLAPSIYLLSYVIMRLRGTPLPASIEIPVSSVLVNAVIFYIFGAGEELGWTGYALDPMQKRWGALRAGILLGLVWAIWHSVAFVQTGNSTGWIVWQSLRTVAVRIVLVWVYNNTGKSISAVILYHASDNLGWSLFPNNGSHYDPLVTGLLNWAVVGIAVMGWGAETLARYRFGHRNP